MVRFWVGFFVVVFEKPKDMLMDCFWGVRKGDDFKISGLSNGKNSIAIY